MPTVKSPRPDHLAGNPFFIRPEPDPGFLLGSLLVGVLIGGFVLVGLALMGAF